MNPPPTPRGNLLRPLPEPAAGEQFEELAVMPGCRVERIVSRGHSTPPGEWYDQDTDEWVMVVEGEGAIEFEGRAGLAVLGPGDWLLIPARCRHRVARTEDPTVWLAVWPRGAAVPGAPG